MKLRKAIDELEKELEGREQIPPHVQVRLDDLATRAGMIKDQLQMEDKLPQPTTMPDQPGVEFYQGPTTPIDD